MTKFIPPYMGEEIKSNAEKKIYDVLQDLELKNAYVLHSLGLPRHYSKSYGEIDFVVVCDRGIACLEIKGGRVERREGAWVFTDRYGVEHVKSEGPFEQVKGNMFSLQGELRERFKANPHIKNVLVACGVMFPDIEFKASSEEIISDIVYDVRTDNITVYLKSVFEYWRQRQRREPGRLSPSDMEEIVDFLRGDFIFVPGLGERLDSIERHLVRLTKEQANIMEALSQNNRLLIEGSAGTGKTLLAINFAKKQAEDGKKVLYLAFNKNLIHHAKSSVRYVKNLKIINIHALFGEFVDIDEQLMLKDDKKYFEEILPELFLEYICTLDKEGLAAIQYDVLVIDEGQDILKPKFLELIDSLLKGGLEKGKWVVFYDANQNIYNPEYESGMNFLSKYSAMKFKLFVNCRNTIQIGQYSSDISGIAIEAYIRENGEDVKKISYVDEKNFKKQIKKVLNELKMEKIQNSDILFLSPKKYRNSLLCQAEIAVNELNDDFDSNLDLPIYATIQGFKGLDSKIVILIDIEKIRKENFSTYSYIAATRARTLLYVVSSEDFWENIK